MSKKVYYYYHIASMIVRDSDLRWRQIVPDIPLRQAADGDTNRSLHLHLYAAARHYLAAAAATAAPEGAHYSHHLLAQGQTHAMTASAMSMALFRCLFYRVGLHLLQSMSNVSSKCVLFNTVSIQLFISN